MITQHDFSNEEEAFESEGGKAALSVTSEWAQGFCDVLRAAKEGYESPVTGEGLELGEAQVKLLFNAYGIFISYLEDVANGYARVTDQSRPEGEPEIEGDLISWSWDQPCGRGCCSDWMHTEMPLHILWTPRSEWKEDFRVQQQKKAEEEARQVAIRKAKEEEERKQRQEINDLKEYKRLQAKYK
jgi:hypothetical protein